MIRENRQLVTNDEPVEVHQDCRRITDWFTGIYRRIYPYSIKENRRVLSTCKPVGLANPRISTDYAQKSPPSLGGTWKHSGSRLIIMDAQKSRCSDTGDRSIEWVSEMQNPVLKKVTKDLGCLVIKKIRAFRLLWIRPIKASNGMEWILPISKLRESHHAHMIIPNCCNIHAATVVVGNNSRTSDRGGFWA